MKKEPSKQQLANELQAVRINYEQLKIQVRDLGFKTAKLYRDIDRIAEPPKGERP